MNENLVYKDIERTRLVVFFRSLIVLRVLRYGSLLVVPDLLDLQPEGLEVMSLIVLTIHCEQTATSGSTALVVFLSILCAN